MQGVDAAYDEAVEAIQQAERDLQSYLQVGATEAPVLLLASCLDPGAHHYLLPWEPAAWRRPMPAASGQQLPLPSALSRWPSGRWAAA